MQNGDARGGAQLHGAAAGHEPNSSMRSLVPSSVAAAALPRLGGEPPAPTPPQPINIVNRAPKPPPHADLASSLEADIPKTMDSITKLLFLAGKGNYKQVKALVDEGADVNGADYDGRTPLHLAASEGKKSIVELLLAAGARVNAVDRWGGTPLSDAVTFGHVEVALMLRNAGARTSSASRHASPKSINMPRVDPSQEWEIDPTELDLSAGKLVGTGAFGEIWKVQWRGTEVAVKKMLQTLETDIVATQEFRDEIALLPKLQHPHIVQFLGACSKPGYPLMIVTEFLPRGNLHDIMFRQRLPRADVFHYALDISKGMNYLHMRKPEAIVHRDLKPRNVLISEAGHLKIADFGLSKLLSFNNLNEKYEMTGETGSYRYMAPEVYRHEAYTKSVDVYSFGIILYELFEGAPAFQYQTAATVAEGAATQDLRPKFTDRFYPDGCKELVSACWDGDPTKRPTFAEIITRLERLQKDMEVQPFKKGCGCAIS
eukprot:jgi/Chlat1/6066/Chrsp4S06345